MKHLWMILFVLPSFAFAQKQEVGEDINKVKKVSVYKSGLDLRANRRLAFGAQVLGIIGTFGISKKIAFVFKEET